jgi:hypothetical protein
MTNARKVLLQMKSGFLQLESTLLYQRVAYKNFLAPVSLDNNFFDTQNLKIFCLPVPTHKLSVLADLRSIL